MRACPVCGSESSKIVRLEFPVKIEWFTCSSCSGLFLPTRDDAEERTILRADLEPAWVN